MQDQSSSVLGTQNKTLYWNMAYCLITDGHDREGLEWADRAMAAAGAVAYFRIGDVETAKRLAAELNNRFPFYTWRARSPNDPDSGFDLEQEYAAFRM